MRSYDLKLDRRGWAQLKRGRLYAQRRAFLRSGLPWTLAEDRALLRRVAGARSIGYADPTVRTAADAHGRSTSAIAARICSLRAGMRLATAAKGIA